MNIFSQIHDNSYLSYAVQMGFALLVLLIVRWRLAQKRKHTPDPGEATYTPIEKTVHTLTLPMICITAFLLFLSFLSFPQAVILTLCGYVGYVFFLRKKSQERLLLRKLLRRLRW